MLSQICGKCSIEQDVALIDRKILASKVKFEQIYQCPSCNIYFGIFNNQYTRNKDLSVMPKQKEIEVIQTNDTAPKIYQTSLF